MISIAKRSQIDNRAVYYALAILHYLESSGSTCLIDDVIDDFTIKHNETDETVLLTDGVLLRDALTMLRQADVIDLDEDPYGPPILSLKISISGAQSRFNGEAAAAIARYLKSGGRKRTWLNSALGNLSQSDNAEIFEPETPLGELTESTDSEEEWAPLPLDRQETELANIIQKIDGLVDDVRSDNGYTVNYPEEKKFVLDKLNAVSKVLKEEATTSWMYL